MPSRQIELDEESLRLLDDLVTDYEGDQAEALSDLLHARESLEQWLDQVEHEHEPILRNQLERSQREFREGRTVSWLEVKRRNKL
ncbi:MAG: hypothetical protein ACKV22_33275 [Bryobacteraceae bacterium]